MALLLGSYCKLWGLSPADELGIRRDQKEARMNVHIACFAAYTHEQNRQYEEAKAKKKNYNASQAEYFNQQLEDDLKQASTSGR